MKAAVYTGTRNIYSDMLTSANSLLYHSDVDKVYFLIEDDTFPYTLPPEVECINVSNQTYFPSDGPNYKNHWTYMALMRVALAKIFPDLDYILSLDADTIIVDDITRLWKIDLDFEDCYLAAVPEPTKSTDESPYVNIGVTLFNLKKIRTDHIDDKLIEALNTNLYSWPEQDCINEICNDKIYTLTPNYNLNTYTYDNDYSWQKPIIYHFAYCNTWRNLPIVEKYKSITNKRHIKNEKLHYSFLTGILDIIIPYYENFNGLITTLESINTYQEYSCYKVTIVDDCSPTPLNRDELKSRFPLLRLQVLHNEVNGGPQAARETGMLNSSYPYLMFIDCGDKILSQWSFQEIIGTIYGNGLTYMFSWPWITEDMRVAGISNPYMMHGHVYAREFLELYDIHFHLNNIYINEDIGFNLNCIMALEDLALQMPGIEWLKKLETPIYKYLPDPNSLTHKDKKNFLYANVVPGLVTHSLYAFQHAIDLKLNHSIIIKYYNGFLARLYQDTIRTELNCKEAMPKIWPYLHMFYNSYIANNAIDESELRLAYSRQLKQLRAYVNRYGIRLNINRFIKLIANNETWQSIL